MEYYFKLWLFSAILTAAGLVKERYLPPTKPGEGFLCRFILDPRKSVLSRIWMFFLFTLIAFFLSIVFLALLGKRIEFDRIF